MEVMSSLVQICPMFRGMPKALVRAMCLKLKQSIILPQEHVVYEGDLATAVHFLSRGQLAVVKEGHESPSGSRRVLDNSLNQSSTGMDATKRVIATLDPGCCFGDIALVMEQKRTASIVSVVWSETWDMEKVDFMGLCKEFAELRRYVRNKVKQHMAADKDRAERAAELMTPLQRAAEKADILESPKGTSQEGALRTAEKAIGEALSEEVSGPPVDFEGFQEQANATSATNATSVDENKRGKSAMDWMRITHRKRNAEELAESTPTKEKNVRGSSHNLAGRIDDLEASVSNLQNMVSAQFVKVIARRDAACMSPLGAA
jgi:CRP-like cAMP-binding protein